MVLELCKGTLKSRLKTGGSLWWYETIMHCKLPRIQCMWSPPSYTECDTMELQANASYPTECPIATSLRPCSSLLVKVTNVAEAENIFDIYAGVVEARKKYPAIWHFQLHCLQWKYNLDWLEISLKFAPKGPSQFVMVLVMAWHWTSNNPVLKPFMTQSTGECIHHQISISWESWWPMGYKKNSSKWKLDLVACSFSYLRRKFGITIFLLIYFS